jgi:hypothetical protein
MRRKGIAMATIVALVAVVAIVAANSGGRDASPPPASAPADVAGFDWLRPSALPAGWTTLPLPGSPARLPVPPDWQPADGDPGTRTAILRGSSGEIAGYLSATPQEGEEPLANWDEFWVDHNRDEGDREVKLLAAVSGYKFASGTGSCVLDSYRTSGDDPYRELACIVAGPSATTVIVGAAPSSLWDAAAPTIERAITSFTT